MRGETAGASSTISSPCRLETSDSTADSFDGPSRSAILSQTIPTPTPPTLMDLTKAVAQKYKVGFGPKKLSLPALMKLSEVSFTQKESESYWCVREDFRNSMTSRKVKRRENRKYPYTVTESIPLESVSKEFYPTEAMIISSGKPELLIADDIKVVEDTTPETQLRSNRASMLLDAHLEDTLANPPIRPDVAVPFESQADQIISNSLEESSGDVPVKDAPTTIARKIDPETTIADNLDKTSYDEICGQIRMTPICHQAAATSPVSCHTDPITIATESLVAPSKDTTFNQISPAKEDEIKAARIRMEAYLQRKADQ
ncbi:unnamed protein product [Caenorhabditis brenneri]